MTDNMFLVATYEMFVDPVDIDKWVEESDPDTVVATIEELHEYATALRSDRENLREALEFYAEPLRWDQDGRIERIAEESNALGHGVWKELDKGYTARRALGEKEE